MHDHSDWYRLFGGFWWLLFPLGWAIGALVKNILRHNRASQALSVLKTYADQGKEPPPELVAVLRQPEQAEGHKRHGDFATWGWIPVFLFGALAIGFGMMSIFPPDDGVPRVAMMFVALVMVGLCLGNLVAMQSQKKQNSPTVIAPEAGTAWAQNARAASADHFAMLVRLHQQPLRAFLRRLTGNAAEADDLAQDSFVFAWEKIARFDPAREFRPWLFAIAWRKYRERKRGWRRMLAREAHYARTRETIDHADPGLPLDLATACATLPVEQRAALLLCLGCDFSHAEAAQALALPLGTVKSHVARGREKLAAFLRDAP